MFKAVHVSEVMAPVGWMMVPYNETLKKDDRVIYGTGTGFIKHPVQITATDYNHPHGFVVGGLAGAPVSSLDGEHIVPGLYYCVCRKTKVVKPPYTPSKWSEPLPLP